MTSPGADGTTAAADRRIPARHPFAASAPLSLSSSEPRELVYDFGGFDPMYYQMRYDTPAATELARQVAAEDHVPRRRHPGPAAQPADP